jgi:hypothetical protein
VHLDGHGGNYWVVSVSDTGALYDDAIVWSCESFIVNLEWVSTAHALSFLLRSLIRSRTAVDSVAQPHDE